MHVVIVEELVGINNIIPLNNLQLVSIFDDMTYCVSDFVNTLVDPVYSEVHTACVAVNCYYLVDFVVIYWNIQLFTESGQIVC